MKGHKQSVNNQIQNQEGQLSKNTAILEQQSPQQSDSHQRNTFDLGQMNKYLSEIQATLTEQNDYAPYVPTQQYTQQPFQTCLENRKKIEQKQSFNQFRDNNQHFIRGKNRNHGYHRGHHHYHNHHMMNHHKDFNKKQLQPENQAGFSDEYWHQYHDRQRNQPPLPHSYNHFNHWNIKEGNHQMYPFPLPPHYLYQQQQYHAYHPPPLHFNQNPYPFHYQTYVNQNEAYQSQNYQGNQLNSRVGQQKVQSFNYPQKKSFKCQYKKRQRNWGGQQGCGRKMKGRKHSKAHSRSSSSSSEENREQYLNEKNKIYISQITQYYTSQLHNLFQAKSINNVQRQKILKFLINKFPKFEAPFQKIFESIGYLQSQNLMYHMPYIKVIKFLVKFKFNMEDVEPKIIFIQAKKIKKYESDLKYTQMYGGEEVQPPLQHGQMIDMNQSNIIYLIDGNNVLPTHKHFRNSFQSTEKYKKLQAQLRFQWLVSFALEPQNVFLFFDQKYQQEDVKIVSSIIFPNKKQRERASKIKIIYGDETIADDKIVQKLNQIQKTQKEVILVSADRELYMRCKKITNIKHTGGRFFFKFLKYVGVHKNQNEKYIKKLIKTVIRNN